MFDIADTQGSVWTAYLYAEGEVFFRMSRQTSPFPARLNQPSLRTLLHILLALAALASALAIQEDAGGHWSHARGSTPHYGWRAGARDATGALASHHEYRLPPMDSRWDGYLVLRVSYSRDVSCTGVSRPARHWFLLSGPRSSGLVATQTRRNDCQAP